METSQEKWDKAIIDAKSELEIAERKVSRLKAAIKILKEQKVNQVTWPGLDEGK